MRERVLKPFPKIPYRYKGWDTEDGKRREWDKYYRSILPPDYVYLLVVNNSLGLPVGFKIGRTKEISGRIKHINRLINIGANSEEKRSARLVAFIECKNKEDGCELESSFHVKFQKQRKNIIPGIKSREWYGFSRVILRNFYKHQKVVFCDQGSSRV